MRVWIGTIALIAFGLTAGGAVYWIADDSGCDITSECDTTMPTTSLMLFIAAGAVVLLGVAIVIVRRGQDTAARRD